MTRSSVTSGLWRTASKIIAHMFRPSSGWPTSAPQIVKETWLDRSFGRRYKEVLDEIRSFEAVCDSFYVEDSLVGLESARWLDALDYSDFRELGTPPLERTPESVERRYRNDFAILAWTGLDLIEKEYGEMMRLLGQNTLRPDYDTGVWHAQRPRMTSEIHKSLFCLKLRIASIQLGLQMNSRTRLNRAAAFALHRVGDRSALKLIEDLDVLRVVIFHGIVGADIQDATVSPSDSPFYRDFRRGQR